MLQPRGAKYDRSLEGEEGFRKSTGYCGAFRARMGLRKLGSLTKSGGRLTKNGLLPRDDEDLSMWRMVNESDL